MKKFIKILLSLSLALSLLFTAAACAEGAMGSGKNRSATASGVGYDGCVIEVTIVVDGFKNPIKVQFDEIFGIKNVASAFDQTDMNNNITIGKNNYNKFIRIGDKFFVGESDGTNVTYKGIGTNTIADAAKYVATAEGAKYYYDSFIKGDLYSLKVDDTGTEVGEFKLKDNKTFNTAHGSMRKRYSKYWSTSGTGTIGQPSGLGFNGNMDALENYLIAYGFDNSDKVNLPGKDGNNSKYNVINGITTGATLSANTSLYINVAKAAYDSMK